MTETEKKALALVNELGVYHYPSLDSASMSDVRTTLCRAIEQHEAFKLEVSDAVEEFYRGNPYEIPCYCDDLKRFIIAKPDPLVEIWNQMIETGKFGPDELRNAMKDRGYEWTKISECSNES